jgi:hypothetical protein
MVDIKDELSLAAASITKLEEQLGRATRDLHTRVAKCTEADGGIFGHLLCNVTCSLFKHLRKIKIKLTASYFSFLTTSY